MKKQAQRSQSKETRSDEELLAYHQKWYDALMKSAAISENDGGQKDNYYRNEAERIMREGIEPLQRKLKASKSGQTDEGQQEQ